MISGALGSGASTILEPPLVLEAANGFDLVPFEANEALRVDELGASIAEAGFVDVPVTLTRQSNIAGMNYFVALAVGEDGATGAVSNVVVLELGRSCRSATDCDVCSGGVCDPVRGCVHDGGNSTGVACDDHNLCTTSDACVDGQCTGSSSCGVPATHASSPTTADALFILRASLALAVCEACECDVNSDGNMTSADALLALRRAVDLPVELVCYAPAGVDMRSLKHQAHGAQRSLQRIERQAERLEREGSE